MTSGMTHRPEKTSTNRCCYRGAHREGEPDRSAGGLSTYIPDVSNLEGAITPTKLTTSVYPEPQQPPQDVSERTIRPVGTSGAAVVRLAVQRGEVDRDEVAHHHQRKQALDRCAAFGFDTRRVYVGVPLGLVEALVVIRVM